MKDEDFIDALSTKFAVGASVVADGDARKAMVGDKAIGDFVKEWAGSDAGKKFVAAPINTGGGAPGGGVPGGKAWTDLNHTEQSMMFRQDSAKAVALAAASGVTLAV